MSERILAKAKLELCEIQEGAVGNSVCQRELRYRLLIDDVVECMKGGDVPLALHKLRTFRADVKRPHETLPSWALTTDK